MSDRFKDMPWLEQLLAMQRRAGYSPFNSKGKLRLPLGEGFESDLIRCIYGISKPEKPSNKTTKK